MQNNQFLLNAHLPSPRTPHFTRPNNVCLFVQDKVAVKLQVGVYTIPPFLMLSVTPGLGLVKSRFNVASIQTKLAFAITCASGPRMLTANVKLQGFSLSFTASQVFATPSWVAVGTSVTQRSSPRHAAASTMSLTNHSRSSLSLCWPCS